MIDAMRPKSKKGNNEPTQSWDDYEVPSELPKELSSRILEMKDLAK